MLRSDIRIPAGAGAPSGVSSLAGRVIVAPDRLGDGPVPVLCCFPGGGMSGRYFEITGFDMAAHLADAGMVVVTIDHPAIGASDVPDDPWTLTAEVVSDVDAAGAGWVLEQVRKGSLVDGLPPLSDITPIGVGHSMGAMLVAYQQARHRLYERLVLLGHSGRGLPEVLTPEELSIAGVTDEIRKRIVELTRVRFESNPLPVGTTAASEFLLGPNVPAATVAAIGETRSALLAVCGLNSMIPGSHDPELASVDVPVMLGVAEFDITGPPHDTPRWLTGSRDVTLYVQPGAFHNANVAASRVALWDRVVSWMRTVPR
jgi:pimeloyl-ACP methyl ester carboxylesterase